MLVCEFMLFFFFQAEDGIRDAQESRGLGDVYKRQGAAAIVVSNHGGRVLDQTPGTADVLPEIAKKVKGKITILADGGVRNGVDVLKMLALGADAVLIGRPFVPASFGGQAEGVKAYIDSIAADLKSAMILTGCNSIEDVNSRILF